ncbi:hypothetical protein GF337_10600 [candidate division KSB1 bacterium]|nr:hypothetical protein [candidate division KSB1 bacterium]
MTHDFRGNIRELENIIEYAFILCRDEIIQIAHLPDNLKSRYSKSGDDGAGGLTLSAIQKRAVEQALIRNNWKKMKTARELNIDKGTLRRMIERLEIKEP